MRMACYLLTVLITMAIAGCESDADLDARIERIHQLNYHRDDRDGDDTDDQSDSSAESGSKSRTSSKPSND